jgi:putative ABC transport system ATP-binding protein
VAVARALASNPAIVFADEPTGNLDRASGAMVADMLFAIARERNATLVVVTHDLEMAKRADRIVEMNDGRIV